MNDVIKMFTAFLELSLLLSPILLALLLCAPLLGKRYAAKARCLLWAVLAARLLFPIGVTGERLFTLYLPLPDGRQAVEDAGLTPEGVRIPRDAAPESGDHPLDLPAARLAVGPQAPNLAQNVTVVWCIGAALFLLYHWVCYLHTRHKLRRWSSPVQDARILEAFRRLKGQHGIQADIALFQSPRSQGPLLMSFFRPRILLPRKNYSDAQLWAILSHELLHYKRGDLWYKLLLLMANAAHWFNPLLYWMSRQADYDMEAACDSGVLKDADAQTRRAYGFAVLAALEHKNGLATALTTRFYSGKKQMLRRFADIAEQPARRKGAALMGVVAAVSFCSGILVGCGTTRLAEPTASAGDPTVPVAAEREPMGTVAAASPGGEGDSASASEKAQVMDALEQLYLADAAGSREKERELQSEISAVFDAAQWDASPYTGGEMIWPAPGKYVVSPYGWRFRGQDFHTGMDIAGADCYGSAIAAANDGVVKFVNTEYTPGRGYGIYLILDHGGGVSTLYAQCSNVLVAVGDSVVRGQPIAQIGSTGFSTGPHLHFEVRNDGAHADPLPYVSDLQQGESFIWPTAGGDITVGFKEYPGHTGIGIDRPVGTPVYASAAGTALEVRDTNAGYGKYILLDHGNGFQTLYAHNSALYVKQGDVVEQGQAIAAVGRSGNATGDSLHFEVRFNGRILNPADYVGTRQDATA